MRERELFCQDLERDKWEGVGSRVGEEPIVELWERSIAGVLD